MLWLISEHKTGQTILFATHFPKNLGWNRQSDSAAFQPERNTQVSNKSPNYYELLANLFTIQIDMDGHFLTGALLLKCLGGRD